MARRWPDPRERTLSAMRRARDAEREGMIAAHVGGDLFEVPSRSGLLPHLVQLVTLGRFPVALCDCRRPHALAAPAGMVSCWHAAAVMVDLAVRDIAFFDGLRWRLAPEACRVPAPELLAA